MNEEHSILSVDKNALSCLKHWFHEPVPTCLVQEPVKNYSVMESLNFQFCCSGRKCLEGFTSIINSPRYLMNTGID